MSWRRLLYLIIMLSLFFSDTISLSHDLAQKNAVYYANDIKELIKIGENVSCIDATIIGDLNLTGLNLQINDSLWIVNSPISIIDSDIKGNLDFGNAIFKRSLDFKGSKFSGQNINFRNSEFDSPIDISGAKFACTASFSGAKFNKGISSVKTIWSEGANLDKIICKGDTSFRESEFQKIFSLKGAHLEDVDFEDCNFNGEAYFSNSIFKNDVNFLAARFADFTDLSGVRFEKFATFTRSRFDDIVDFSRAKFANETKFYYASFANSANFCQARFYAKTDFRKCVFDGYTDFSSASFLGVALFDESQFNKATRFTNSTFQKNTSFSETYFDRGAYFEASGFGSMLDITNATFSELALPWDAIDGRIIYDKATQLSLIDNYKKLGWTGDYRKSYYRYKEEKRISEPLGYAKALDTISWIYWGYGTKMYNPVAYIFSSALIFAFIYYGLVRLKWAEVVKKSSPSGCERCPWAKTEEETHGDLSFKKALIFSIKTILPMEKPDDFKINYAHIGKIIWIEIAVFGFLAAHFVNYLLEQILSYFKPL